MFKLFIYYYVAAATLLLLINVKQLECTDDTKIIVDAPEYLIHPHPNVKPTEKPILHEPGVPPNIATVTTPKPVNCQQPQPTPIFDKLIQTLFGGNKRQRRSDDEAVEVINITDHETSPTLNLILNNGSFFNNNNAQNSSSPPNKGVVDWVLGLVGLNNNNNNNNVGANAAKDCETCTCGVPLKQIRIVGGVETQVNAYPWMVYLTYNGRFYCGASAINNKYLLTAAHCVNGFSKDRLTATFLDHDRSSTFETKTFTRRIQSIYKHRGYNKGGSYNNDIALLRLDDDLSFKGLMRPVCLPTIGRSFTGLNGIAVGWGATEEHGQVSNKLREVEVPIISNIDCRRTGYGDKITENMLCAGYKEGKKDSCQGDSGGPLQVVNSTLYSIVGIVSWGEGCAEANFPGVYTRVNRFVTWIRSNTKDACYCS